MSAPETPSKGGLAARLAEHLRGGALHFNATAHVQHVLVIEALCRAGYDSITFDVQHGSFDYQGVLLGVAAAASTGTPSIVRVALDDHGFAARCLDAGVAGILAPMINTAADARKLVAATRYPPVGQRSWGPNRALGQSGLDARGYLESANAGTVVLAMIETREALDNVDEIVGIEGIDGLFVGPLDLGISLAGGAASESAVQALETALETVAVACRAHAKIAGIYAGGAEAAGRYARAGYGFIALALDLALLDRGARELRTAAVDAVRS